MDEEEAITSGDQLRVISDWLDHMEAVDKTERWSYSEIAEVQAVYDLVRGIA